MGRIDIIIPDELEHKLRMAAGARLGARRGAFTQAILEGVKLWLDPETAGLVKRYRRKESRARTKERRE
jgi:hypothetical protein